MLPLGASSRLNVVMEIENLNDEENAMAKATKNDPKTYEAKMPDGRTVRVTVPESDNREWPELLAEAIREVLSPEAVAAIAAHLLAAKTNSSQINRQVAWFTDHLIQMLGVNEYPRLCERLGL